MRWSAVPWLLHSDLAAGQSCRTRIECGAECVSAWTVESPWGEEDACMVIRALKGNVNDGGVITLALTDRVDMDSNLSSVPVQSNPRRAQADGDDGNEWCD